jgi:hypothetical protein
MTPSRSRDRFRLGVSSLTAIVSAGSLTVVGWFAGTAAREQQAKQAHDDAARAIATAKAASARAKYDAAVARQKSASFSKRVVLRARPTRTVVRTQYVQGAAAPVVVGGGTFSPPGSPPPIVHQPPPPVHHTPPPPPPPAPSSGSHHG